MVSKNSKLNPELPVISIVFAEVIDEDFFLTISNGNIGSSGDIEILMYNKGNRYFSIYCDCSYI